jgi:hypothetical protein
MDAYYASVTNPLYVMANAALAGVINMIPGAQAGSTEIYHATYDQGVAAGMPAHHLEAIKSNATAWGWW